MCGIVGVFNVQGQAIPHGTLDRMNKQIHHRGPDGGGILVVDTASGDWAESHQEESPGRWDLGFGHRRLSIIDLSPAGHQPMGTDDGRLWITFNGEVYNFKEIRDELLSLGYTFKSFTDTEVILRAYQHWGEASLERLNGMFAFAIWDQRERTLFIARDRLGIKPLYYSARGGTLAFASEIKALFALPTIRPELDYQALDQYLSFLWVPDPKTAFKDILKLPPGHFMRVRDGEITLRAYWDLDFQRKDSLSEREAIEQFQALFADSVELQMIADVPLGAFLSGGLDSSAILAHMVKQTAHAPTTYTVGYSKEDLRYDVVPDDVVWARKVGKLFAVNYNEILLQPQVVDLLPKIVWHMDEPVADPAAISNYLICQAAREKLTVMLSGMGGDEIFAGYPRHLAAKLADTYTQLPAALRRAVIEPLFRTLPASVPGPFNAVFRNAKKLLRDASKPPVERYLGYGTYFTEAEKPSLLSSDLLAAFQEGAAYTQHRRYFDHVKDADFVDQMCYVDIKTFLPCLNLTYSDKMSMAHSLEVRVPFLDHRLVEFAARLAPDLKLNGYTRKYILKRAMEHSLPKDVIYRKKAGFGAPIRAWLANDLRDMVGDLLSEQTIRRRGLFDPVAVRGLLDDLYSGREDNSLKVWQLLTLELWLQRFFDEVPSDALVV